MFNEQSLKDNAARIAAFFVVSVALYFDYRSLSEHETPNNHKNFDIASAISTVAGMLNVLSRVYDHWGNPKKSMNIKMAAPIISLLISQICFSTLSASNKFEQPIALPGLIGSFTLMFFTGLNWEPVSEDAPDHCVSLMKKNAGRIGGVFFATACATAASFSIALNSKTLFFAATTANSLASSCDSLSRVFDIVYFDKDKTTLLNKAAVILFFALVLASSVLSGLATAKVWEQPIDLAQTLFRLHILCYMVAQYTFAPTKEAQLLLPAPDLEKGLDLHTPVRSLTL